MSISEELKSAIKASKETRYAIAVNSKVDHAVLRRFMSGERDIKLSTAERLAQYLGLELKKSSSKPKPKKKSA
jgi:transcriptional regulator with XRE-family HTH domain